MPTNRGRGWRRIGIVLSVLWFVGFPLYQLFSDHSRNLGLYEAQTAACRHALMEDRLSGEEQLSSRYRKCLDDANLLLRMADDGLLTTGLPLFAFFGSVMIFLAWLIVWGLVAVVRWVNRGFAAE